MPKIHDHNDANAAIEKAVATAIADTTALLEPEKDKAVALAVALAVARVREEKEEAVARIQAEKGKAVARIHAEKDKAVARVRAGKEEAVRVAVAEATASLTSEFQKKSNLQSTDQVMYTGPSSSNLTPPRKVLVSRDEVFKPLSGQSDLFSESMEYHNDYDLRLNHTTMSASARSGMTKLQRCVDECRKNTDYHAWVVLVQSPGAGKTRACLQSCYEERSIYIECSDKDNGPSIPSIIKYIIEKLNSATTTTDREKLCAKFLYTLLHAAARFDTIEELNDAQFVNGRFFTEVYDIWFPLNETDGTPLPSAAIHSNIDYFNPSGVKTIYFDEAMGLNSFIPSGLEGSKSFNPEDKYSTIRCMQREVRMLYAGIEPAKRPVAVALSTLSKLADLTPGHCGSRRDNIVYYPVVTFAYNDVFAHEFVNDLESCKRLWTLGRPLWYATLTVTLKDSPTPMKSLIQYAMDLLQRYAQPQRSDSLALNDADAALPSWQGQLTRNELVACSFALILVSFQPHRQFCDYFISQHLATLVSVAESYNKGGVCSYPSEPILAEAVMVLAAILPNHYSLLNIVLAVTKQMHSTTQILDISKEI